MTTPVQIYIVDDEPAVRAAYARLVRSAKMEPLTFCTVEEFLEAKVADKNACILSDIRMPGSSGLELPGLLSKAGRHLPVIFTTAHDTPETRDIAQRAGAAGFFRKPVDGQALLDAIEWALGKPPNSNNLIP
ncbi:MAG TPA: response regulator [Candidatus Saccharimonadia bacterium]|nr:response regulator [Candidatus Saccharimonadia bacterium]